MPGAARMVSPMSVMSLRMSSSTCATGAVASRSTGSGKRRIDRIAISQAYRPFTSRDVDGIDVDLHTRMIEREPSQGVEQRLEDRCADERADLAATLNGSDNACIRSIESTSEVIDQRLVQLDADDHAERRVARLFAIRKLALEEEAV